MLNRFCCFSLLGLEVSPSERLIETYFVVLSSYSSMLKQIMGVRACMYLTKIYYSFNLVLLIMYPRNCTCLLTYQNYQLYYGIMWRGSTAQIIKTLMLRVIFLYWAKHYRQTTCIILFNPHNRVKAQTISITLLFTCETCSLERLISQSQELNSPS